MSLAKLLLYLAATISLSGQETIPTFGTTVYVPGGLTGAIYFIEPTTNLPNLSKLKPVGNIYTNVLNVPLTEFRDGFPGVTDRFEWFAIDYTGRFHIANPGTYRFMLSSDDGAKLFIDNKLIIDNDGVGRRESGGSVKLSSGIHEIHIPYFQGPRYHLCLILRVSRPGDPSFRVFDTDDFAPPLTSDPATPEIDARKPPLADRQEAVQRAATKAASYNSSLPDFICTEVLDRSENRSKHGWQFRDNLTVQLNYTGHKEDHKLVAQDGRPSTANLASMGGALSEGEFGSILADIFRPATAQFEWSHQQALRGHNVYVFTYKVAKEKSGYAIQYSGGRARASNNIFVAYHGTVFIDPETGDVLRLIRIADLPSEFPVRTATSTIDYGVTNVGGRQYLLPTLAQIELSTSVLQTHNEVRFLDYRKFEADVTITFPDKP